VVLPLYDVNVLNIPLIPLKRPLDVV
jgi:hypothetical protein